MKLKELLRPQMVNERYRPSDIARNLNKTRQSVSYALGRNIDRLRVKTILDYAAAVDSSIEIQIKPLTQ